jgi:type-F conjugative transfer system pilin assembly protein TrbC
MDDVQEAGMLRILKEMTSVLIIAGVLTATSWAWGKTMTTPDLRDFIQTGEEAAGRIGIRTNPDEEEGRKRAAAVDSWYRSEEFQNRLQAEIRRIKREVFDGVPEEKTEGAAEYYSDAVKEAGGLPSAERLYILVSSSVPLTTLRAYARDLDRLRHPHIAIVFRGFIGGMKKIKPTLDYIRTILAKNGICKQGDPECATYAATVQIDPLIFQRYGIEEVPAFVYARNVQVRDAGMSPGIAGNASVGEYLILRGDVSLEYALETINREMRSSHVDAVLDSLRGGFYRKGR